MRLRSHVYSSCLARHAAESAAPLPGKSDSARRVTECTSKIVPYASNTSADISRGILEPLFSDATIGALATSGIVDVHLPSPISFATHAVAGADPERDLLAA